MSGSSKVIVVDPDPRVARQILLGFEREGVAAATAQVHADAARLALAGDGQPALVIVGGVDGAAVELVRRTRKLLDDSGADVPIVFAGRGVARADAEAAGADEVLLRPTYLRDLVTIARIWRGVPANQRAHIVGSLADTTGVYTLVRALAALGRSAVLTLIRGLRRGEIRFYQGEVTSAQVGLIHGQAALHQLLLWTDARFDFQYEDIVRRHQIPLTPDELFADAERFLEGVREHAGALSPAIVLEQDVARIHRLGAKIPTEVHGVLRMFDGHRVLADILEDSPYRVFETLRVAQKALETGLVREAAAQRPKATWKAVLAIEEWLVGSETREDVVERTAKLDSGPVSGPVGGPKKTGARKRRKKRRANTPAPVAPIAIARTATADIDWGPLVPRAIGGELGPLAGVVPATGAVGEIEVHSRTTSREGLEALMDTDKRDKIFPTEIGLEPKVVVGDTSAPVRELLGDLRLVARHRDAREEHGRAATEPATRQGIADAAHELDTAGAEARAKQLAEAERERAATQATVQEAVERMRIERERREDEEARARARADARAADLATAAMIAVPQPQPTPGAAPAPVAAAVPAEPVAVPVPVVASLAPESVGPEPAMLVARAEVAPVAPEPAQVAPEPALISPIAPEPAPVAVEPAQVAVEPAQVAPESAPVAPEPAPVALEPAPVAVEPAQVAPAARVAPEPAQITHQPAQVMPEPAQITPELAPVTPEPARISHKPDGPEPAMLVARARPTPAMAEPARPAAPAIDADAATTPFPRVERPIDDESSDGIIRTPIANADTARLARRARRTSSQPESDGPPHKTAMGEIAPRAPAAAPEADAAQPSILIDDLAAAHAAVGKVAIAQTAHAATEDAATAGREHAVAEVRKDAVAFSDAEEAFFRAGQHAQSAQTATLPKVESFDDLDEGYQPVGFWDRVLGRRRPSTPTGHPIVVPPGKGPKPNK